MYYNIVDCSIMCYNILYVNNMIYHNILLHRRRVDTLHGLRVRLEAVLTARKYKII